MHITQILTPDEAEFKDYLLHADPSSIFNSYININDYKINYISVDSLSRRWFVGFKSDPAIPHERPDKVFSFELIHNHGFFLINDFKIEKNFDEILLKNNLIEVKQYINKIPDFII